MRRRRRSVLSRRTVDIQIAGTLDILHGLKGPTILDHLRSRHVRTPFLEVRRLFAVGARPYAQASAHLSYVPSAYANGRVTQDRRASAPSYRMRRHTGMPAHKLLVEKKTHEEAVDYYFGKDWPARASVTGELLVRLTQAAVEHQVSIPLSLHPASYLTSRWEERLPGDAVPLYANSLEAALALWPRPDAEQAVASYLSLATPSPWHDLVRRDLHAALRPLDVLGLGRRSLEALGVAVGDVETPARIAARAGIRPDDVYEVPSLGKTRLDTYVAERLAWIVLLGDNVLLGAALGELARYKAEREKADLRDPARVRETNRDLGHFFFSFHHMYTSHVFSARGGYVNASEADCRIWMRTLGNAKKGDPKGRIGHRLFHAAWQTADRLKVLLGNAQGGGLSAGDAMRWTTIQPSTAEHECGSWPEMMASSRAETPRLDGQGPAGRIEAHRRAVARICEMEHTVTPYHAARKTTIGMVSTAPLQLLSSIPEPLSTMIDLVDVLATSAALADLGRTAKAFASGVRDHSLLGFEGHRSNFFIWAEGSVDMTDDAGRTPDGAVVTSDHRR